MASPILVPGLDWQLDVLSREIVRDGRRVRLPEKPFLVLEALVAGRGEVVTRADLQARLWSEDTFVDFDNNLNSAVAALRQALSDSARAPKYIETIPKVGYRLLIPNDGASAETVVRPPVPSHASLPREPSNRPVLAYAIVAAMFVVSATGVALVSRSGPDRPAPADEAAATTNPAARASFERGVYQRGQYLGSRDRPDLLTAARDAFAEAARMDPEFAAAIAQEGETLVEMSFAGALRFREGLSLARDAARRAIAKGAGPGTAARVMGVATLFLEWDFEGSQRWLDRAAVNRADAKTSMARAIWFAAAGRADEAVESAEQAVALDPASYYVRADLAMFYLGAGRNADAAESSRRVLGVAPDFVPARLYAIAASERLDQWSEAAGHARALMASGGASAAELAALERVDARAAVTLWRRWDLSRLEQQAAGRREDYALQLALRHAALGDRVTALDELSVALERRHALLVFLRSFPELTGLRGDPAFEAIARALTPGHAPLSAGHPSSD